MRALTALLSAATLLALPAFAQRAPNPTEQSAAISAIREYAVNYTQRLPDYACTQVTQWRGQPFQVLLLGSPRSGEVETQIGFVNHREMEKVTAINGKPAALAEPKDLPPTSAHGEFGSPGDDLRSANPNGIPLERWATRGGRRMYVFSYRLPKLAGYVLQEGKRTTVIPVKGLVYADFETNAVTRIEVQGTDIPETSSYQSLELTLNYKLIRVADREFMLPSDFKLTSRQRDGSSRLDIELDAQYKDYRRFTADATIQFVNN